MSSTDNKFIIEKNKEQIIQIRRQLIEATDPREKRRLKRRLKQVEIEQIKYLNKSA